MRLIPALTLVLILTILAVSSAFAQVGSSAGAAKPVSAGAATPTGNDGGAPPPRNDVDVWKIVESLATAAAAIVALGSAYVAWKAGQAAERAGQAAEKSGQAADEAKVKAENLARAANISLEASAASAKTSADIASRALDETKESDRRTINAVEDQVAQQVKANEQAIILFQGNSIFQLYAAWDNARFLPHADKPDPPHVVQGVRALALTATTWLGKLIDHDVLYDDYWGNYEALFKQIIGLKPIIQNGVLIINPPNLLTPSIKKAYGEMQAHGEARVHRPSITP